jgi:hypothetical protein
MKPNSISKGNYKEAFGTAGKYIRLFLSHDAGIKKEVNNELVYGIMIIL